jgi:hypothetical protein
MLRTLFPVIAFAGSIIAGLVLAYLFLLGSVGTATMLVASFAFAALALTAAVLHWPGEDETVDDRGPDLRM